MRTLPTPGDHPQIPSRDASRPGSTARRRVALAAILIAMVLGLVGGIDGFGPGRRSADAQTPGSTVAPTTSAASTPTSSRGEAGVVSVVTVNGLIDPALAAFMNRTIDDAERVKAKGLVFQVDLDGSVVPSGDLAQLLDRIRNASIPVYVWIGPTGSQLTGQATALAGVAKGVAMAPGTSIGDAGAIDLATSPLKDPKFAGLTAGLLDAKQAEDARIATFAPTIGDYIVGLPGVQTNEITVNGQIRREPVTQVVFTQLSILDSFMHTAASPAVAYLMLTVGLALLIFELFTAGVGVAGVIGAASFVLSCYGLAALPIRWWGLALIVLAMVGFAIDVQTGVPRFWTGAGLVLYALGSFTLYDGVSMSWLTIGVGIGGVALAFLAGMPSMVRTRFSTPTIGREWMIGELGRAVTDINPDGVVQIQDAPWRAYTNRATPIEQLDRVRVVGIEGLVLEVEPEEGGARDYRERRPKGETDSTA